LRATDSKNFKALNLLFSSGVRMDGDQERARIFAKYATRDHDILSLYLQKGFDPFVVVDFRWRKAAPWLMIRRSENKNPLSEYVKKQVLPSKDRLAEVIQKSSVLFQGKYAMRNFRRFLKLMAPLIKSEPHENLFIQMLVRVIANFEFNVDLAENLFDKFHGKKSFIEQCIKQHFNEKDAKDVLDFQDFLGGIET